MKSKRISRRYSKKMKRGGAEDEDLQEKTTSCQACKCNRCFELEAHVKDFPGAEAAAAAGPGSSSLLPIDNVEGLMNEGSISSDEEAHEGGKRRRKKRRSHKSKSKSKSKSKKYGGNGDESDESEESDEGEEGPHEGGKKKRRSRRRKKSRKSSRRSSRH